MADEPKDPHLNDPSTGTKHGVPAGAAQEDSKGMPNSERHESETRPVHRGTDKGEKEKAGGTEPAPPHPPSIV
jgi:hypothetical protein